MDKRPRNSRVKKRLLKNLCEGNFTELFNLLVKCLLMLFHKPFFFLCIVQFITKTDNDVYLLRDISYYQNNKTKQSLQFLTSS